MGAVFIVGILDGEPSRRQDRGHRLHHCGFDLAGMPEKGIVEQPEAQRLRLLDQAG
jgi:hypothetical protein